MKILLISLVLVAGSYVTEALYGKDSSVCNGDPVAPEKTPTNIFRPNITGQFATRIEVTIVNKNKSTIIHEYFDKTNNRGFIYQKQDNIRFDAWYDYNTNEFITYYPDLPSLGCKVQDLGKSDERYLLGYQLINGKAQIFSANDALHYGGKGINEVYMGQEVIRDINVEKFSSCQYWQSMDATMNVDWYFSARNTWDSAVGVQVPVMAHVSGIVHNGTSSHMFNHYYNFFDFRPYLGVSDQVRFETPAGVVCPGRQLTRKFPQVAGDAFSFTTEVLDMNSNMITFLKETFYYDQKLVKFEYRTRGGESILYGQTDLIEIHDFHSGVAYITDKSRGNCTYRKIEGGGFDSLSSGPNTVRIRNSKEFFYLGKDKDVSYEGIKRNRDIDCDAWVADRTDFPFDNPSNSTWEWYFASNQWEQTNSGPEAGAIPVQMRIKVPSRNWDYQYNLYNFQNSKPDILGFDISGCYAFRQRRKFQLLVANVTSTTMTQITNNINIFRYYVLQSIMTAASLTPLRVANLQVFFTQNIVVTFELLDVAPIVGDVQKSSSYKETSLEFASNTLMQMIQNGQFVITLGGTEFSNIPPLVAQANNIVEITYTNNTNILIQNTQATGYGAGPMAGVGISMPILGAGLGVVFAYFFFR